MMTLGQRIMELRTAAGLSQEALGAKLGTTRQTVSRWELDQAVPTIDRIVQLSRLFSVTTDSLLVENISTFAPSEDFLCGVYRGEHCELVETERFAFVLAESADGQELSARLYTGSCGEKQLLAVCIRRAGRTDFAWRSDGDKPVFTSGALTRELGQPFDHLLPGKLRRRESFRVDHSGAALPTVSEAGIRRCLTAWRMGDSLTVTQGQLHFFLCTGKTEYVMQLRTENTDVYCGASFNIPFDMGLMSGGQYFRLRNYGDNSAPWCSFFSDFSCMPRAFDIPLQEIRPGLCVNTSEGLMWCVKRCTDGEIVLQGCGEDEYVYRRADRRTETFTLSS